MKKSRHQPIAIKCQNLAFAILSGRQLPNLALGIEFHWSVVFKPKCQNLVLAHEFGITLKMILVS